MADSSKSSASKRPNGPGKPFVKGQSGNPGGKSLEREALRREAQQYLAETGMKNIRAIERLAETAKSAKVRLDARLWLAEQFIGKPTQAISGPDGGPIRTVDLSKLTLAQLETLEALRKAASGE